MLKNTLIKKVILAKPRGFCAGVTRAIDIVETALAYFGSPIFIKHQIVHNKTVCADLENKGAIIVETVDEIPFGSTVIFSAHGSSALDYKKAHARNLKVIDATCPLVAKVQNAAKRFLKQGYKIVYIGKKKHQEARAVSELCRGKIEIIEKLSDVDKLWKTEDKIVYLTQTTLSINDAADIIAKLKEKFPQIAGLPKGDICYATTNRQLAARALSKISDLVLVVGSVNSSNSNRLSEVAKEQKTLAYLVDNLYDIKSDWLISVETMGLTAGASAPEKNVREIVDFFVQKGAKAEEIEFAEEKIDFDLPQIGK